ncbi:MAG: hypothetical protein Q7T57_06450 [Dehalococcoidales bacterium]|nr:hypothetical protein [Dehalococcoidales bacterium]
MREPRTVGLDLDEFAANGLIDLISEAVCGKTHTECDEEECDGCVGMVALGHLTNQIGQEGIKFMRQLVKEWHPEEFNPEYKGKMNRTDELNTEQLESIDAGKCPDCGGELLTGPRGGLSRKCSRCTHEFNVVMRP